MMEYDILTKEELITCLRRSDKEIKYWRSSFLKRFFIENDFVINDFNLTPSEIMITKFPEEILISALNNVVSRIEK